MVNCPKCNFTQPKDQFCANCGIDMGTYRPVQAPLASRLLKNWIFQFSLFVFAVVVGVGLIRAKNKAPLSDSIAAIEQATSNQKNFVSKKPIDKKFAQISSASSIKPAAENSPYAKPDNVMPSPENSGAQPVGSGQQSAASKAIDGSGDSANPMVTKLKLVFAELNRGTFAALMGDSRNIASFGVYFAGLLPEQSDKSKSEFAGVSILDSASDLQIKLNQPIVVFKGSRDPQTEQNMGLTTQITPTFIDEQGAHLQIDIKRSLRSPTGTAGPMLEENFQEQMILKKGSRGYISGLLPHRVLGYEEARVLSANPTILKVLASGDFQSSNSEFVVFIEAK